MSNEQPVDKGPEPITKTVNGVEMILGARCFWGELCDVGIFQVWKHPDRPQHQEFIELTWDEAEKLIIQMQAAIEEAKRISREYADHCASTSNMIWEEPDAKS